MIKYRVCLEMYNTKGYIKQIELYTNRKRKVNRRVFFFIVFSSLLCAITACFPQCRWATFTTSIVIAATTIIREFKPMYGQPEEELRELEYIGDFYKSYLQELEKLFISRFDKSSDMDDIKMNELFDAIVKTKGNEETNLNRLCRNLKKEEREIIQKDTESYFDASIPETRFYKCK